MYSSTRVAVVSRIQQINSGRCFRTFERGSGGEGHDPNILIVVVFAYRAVIHLGMRVSVQQSL